MCWFIFFLSLCFLSASLLANKSRMQNFVAVANLRYTCRQLRRSENHLTGLHPKADINVYGS